MKGYIVALDQGTTSSRAILVDRQGQVRGISQVEFPQFFPQPGWVEHDPWDIVTSSLQAFNALLKDHDLSGKDIDCIGITNQRETVVVWDKRTGKPFYNAIVWQCRRTAQALEALQQNQSLSEKIQEKTGLIPDPYFSASKIAWILNHVEGAREAACAGHALFGTIDSWLIWNLTGGKVHATDPTNASRTMLYNIHEHKWDLELCDLFSIPTTMLPEVRPSSGLFGVLDPCVLSGDIPIFGVAGDQQAALFGQCCFESGQVKATFGTGCFLLMNTGDVAYRSNEGLVTTIAATPPGASKMEYALEGSIFMAGALIKWLHEDLGLIDHPAHSQVLAESVEDTLGVYVVPAFVGLGAPYWDADARGSILGLTRGVTKAHIVRACLEAQALQVYDVLESMKKDTELAITALKVDGGVSRNDFILQSCADILDIPIYRPTSTESTALGAAYLAGLSSGFWKNADELKALQSIDRIVLPQWSKEQRRAKIKGWHESVCRTKSRFPSV